MDVLILSPYAAPLERILRDTGDRVAVSEDYPDLDSLTATEWIVSYGFRRLIKAPLLDRLAGRIVNLHISLLPWNRGADPNFWSWFDDTPKGVSLHLVDAGMDTGALLAQREVAFGADETLATSYATLRRAAESLFGDCWPDLRAGRLQAMAQHGEGSYHRAQDKAVWMPRLDRGWDTPVSVVQALGARHRHSLRSG